VLFVGYLGESPQGFSGPKHGFVPVAQGELCTQILRSSTTHAAKLDALVFLGDGLTTIYLMGGMVWRVKVSSAGEA